MTPGETRPGILAHWVPALLQIPAMLLVYPGASANAASPPAHASGVSGFARPRFLLSVGRGLVSVIASYVGFVTERSHPGQFLSHACHTPHFAQVLAAHAHQPHWNCRRLSPVSAHQTCLVGGSVAMSRPHRRCASTFASIFMNESMFLPANGTDHERYSHERYSHERYSVAQCGRDTLVCFPSILTVSWVRMIPHTVAGRDVV